MNMKRPSFCPQDKFAELIWGVKYYVNALFSKLDLFYRTVLDQFLNGRPGEKAEKISLPPLVFDRRLIIVKLGLC